MTDERDVKATAVISTYGTLLVVARRGCERSKDVGQEAIVAIVFSALAVEGFVNHLATLTSGPLAERSGEELRAFAGIMGDLEDQRVGVETKIQMAYYVLTREVLDRGALPYQDFSLLVDLRNGLVHSRPERIDWPPRTDWNPHRLVQRLVDRKVIPKPSSGQAPQFQAVVCCHEVACWAYNLALTMMNFLIEALPAGDFKESSAFIAGNFPPI